MTVRSNAKRVRVSYRTAKNSDPRAPVTGYRVRVYTSEPDGSQTLVRTVEVVADSTWATVDGLTSGLRLRPGRSG